MESESTIKIRKPRIVSNRICGIYAIYDDSRLVYIGQSVNLNLRKSQHLCELRNNKHNNRHLQHIFNLRKDSLSFNILELCDRADLNIRESFFITTLSPVCNILMPDKNGNPFMPTESMRRNISERMRGRKPWNFGIPRSDAEKQAIRRGININNPNGRIPWNVGIGHSDDTKLKISIANSGKYHSEEKKRKMSDYMKNHPNSGQFQRGQIPHNRSFSDSQVFDILTKYTPYKYTQKMLAAEYGVNEETIGAIVRRKGYKNG
jgi:group I intron endonuclease